MVGTTGNILMTSTQPCLKTVELEQPVDRLTGGRFIAWHCAECSEWQVEWGWLALFVCRCSGKCAPGMAAASEFPFKYLEGFVGTRLYQSLITKIGIGPHHGCFQFIFTGRSFFFWGGFCPVNQLSPNIPLNKAFIEALGNPAVMTRQVGIRSGRYMFEAGGPCYRTLPVNTWVWQILFCESFWWNYWYVQWFYEIYMFYFVTLVGKWLERLVSLHFLAMVPIHESGINLQDGSNTVSIQYPHNQRAFSGESHRVAEPDRYGWADDFCGMVCSYVEKCANMW